MPYLSGIKAFAVVSSCACQAFYQAEHFFFVHFILVFLVCFCFFTDTEDVKLRSVKSTEDRSSENLMLKLELETKCNENESSINISKEGIGNLKDIDDNLSPVSSGDFHNSFGEQVESGNFINSPREEKEDSNSCESDMECQEESKAITDEDESNNGNNDDNDSDNDSGSENSSEEDGEVNDSGDGNVCNQDNQEGKLTSFIFMPIQLMVCAKLYIAI